MGLSKRGLGPKGANWAKKGPFGAVSALPPWLWGAEELVPMGPEKAPIGPKGPNSPRKGPISWKGVITLIIEMIACNFFWFSKINFLKIAITTTF